MLDSVDSTDPVTVAVQGYDLSLDGHSLYFLCWSEVEFLEEAFGLVAPLRPGQRGGQPNGGDWAQGYWAWARKLVHSVEDIIGFDTGCCTDISGAPYFRFAVGYINVGRE